ncbi:MAG TPA: ABC transporter permease subunit [Symbiobacteriaceae bacterium]
MNRSRRWYLVLGLLLLGALLFIALFADHITAVSPLYRDARSHVMDGTPPFPPESGHSLGTDPFGRDIWSRVAYGARWSLLFAVIVAGTRLLIAVPAALGAVFGPRSIDWLMGRLYVFSSAVPPLLIYLLMLSTPGTRLLGLWPSVALTAGLLTFIEWPRLAIALKGRMEQLLNEPFVEGAVAAGATPGRIFRAHLLPHLWPLLMQLAAQELGRALLVMAQLGIFGVMMGGGVIESLLDARGGMKNIITSGIPEWGGMLGDARQYVLVAPWIAFAPALAFFIGVTGANLVAQGLEGVTVSLVRVQEATTGRLSPRWRWLLVPVAAGGLLWYFQGLPWGREQAVRDLARRQAELAADGSVTEYVATLDPQDLDFRRERACWVVDPANTLVADAAGPERVELNGSRATAWVKVAVAKAEPGASAWKPTYYVRSGGRWYEVARAYARLRGFHVDVTAPYNPNDPSFIGVGVRSRVEYLATAADHAFEQIGALFPAGAARARPQLKLFASQESYRAVVLLESGREPGAATLWWTGDRLLVAPAFVRNFDRAKSEMVLAGELVKMALPPGARGRMPPLAVGLLTLRADIAPAYRVDFREMAGSQLFSLEELFETSPSNLPPERKSTYTVQSVVLVQFLYKWLSPAAVESLARSGAGLEEVARQAGVPVAQLSAAYTEAMYGRVAEESVLTVPAGSKVPLDLKAAVNAQRASARTKDEALILDVELDKEPMVVYLLERLTVAGRPPVTAVVKEAWVFRGGQWSMTQRSDDPFSGVR